MKDNTITINGVNYTFSFMPPATGVVLQTKLLKIIAPVMFLLNEKKDENNEEVDMGVKAISTAFENLSESDIGYILRNLEEFTMVNTQRCSINEHFLGKTLTLYKVIFGFLKYNFSDFFELLPKGFHIEEKLTGAMKESLKIQ